MTTCNKDADKEEENFIEYDNKVKEKTAIASEKKEK